MIKIALKHFIYEKCIDILFNAITRNFSIVKKGTKVELPHHFLETFNIGFEQVPDSMTFIHFKYLFDSYTLYDYRAGWVVDSNAIPALTLHEDILSRKIEHNATEMAKRLSREKRPYD